MEFTKLNAGNITEVKSAIKNKKGVIIFNEEPDSSFNNAVITEKDIYSLYDHSVLFIFRIEDTYFVGKLEKYYKIINDYIIVASVPTHEYLFSKMKLAGIDEGSSMWTQVENIIHKCDQLQDELDKQLKKEKGENPIDDIFSLFNSSIEDMAGKDSTKKNNDCLSVSKEGCDHDCEHCPNHLTDEEFSNFMEEFKKEHNGRIPLPHEALLFCLEKKFGSRNNDERDQETKMKFEKLQKGTELTELLDLIYKAVINK